MLTLIEKSGKVRVNSPFHPGNAGLNYLAHGDVSAQNGMAFGPKGTRLAAAYAKTKTVVVWDIVDRGNPDIVSVGNVNTLAFTGDDKRLATASTDGTWQVWPLDAQDLIAAAQRLAGRSLKVEECKIYQVEPCPQQIRVAR